MAVTAIHGVAQRMFNVFDEHLKEIQVLRPERRIGPRDIMRCQTGIAKLGALLIIRSENGLTEQVTSREA